MRNIFEAQLRNSVPTDGNFLQTVTSEQMIQTFTSLQKMDPVTYADPEAYLELKMADYQKHIGEKVVYFLAYHAPKVLPNGTEAKCSVFRAWESEIDALADEWEVLQPTFIDGSTLPRLKQKVDYE
jgi:hypothetical protein